VLEVLPDESRLNRLHTIIAACGSSLHDMSCTAAKNGIPRFNMPFELGMLAGLRKRFFVFEEKHYRLQKTLSDLNGHDPKIHGGKVVQVLAGLRDLFKARPVQPSLKKLETLLYKVETLSKRIEAEQGSIIGRQAFEELVYGAQQLAKKLDLT
jgi:hypothetical protein